MKKYNTKKITLNPDYFLRHDKKRSYILSWHSYHSSRYNGEEEFNAFIHPVHAMILSFFYGKEIYESINEASNTLGLPINLIENFIESLIENKENVGVKFDNILFSFPKMTLINAEDVNGKHIKRYSFEMFRYTEIDFTTHRQYTPTDITLMLNNICVTDCIYCYVDRRNKMQSNISVERIKELINEAKNLQVRSFELSGGELFLYPKWEEILKYLKKQQIYLPFISTKMPLSSEIIKKLRALDIETIQISLDTLIEKNLKKVINIKSDYIDKIKDTISKLEEYGINVIIHTILTKYNSNTQDMESVFNFLSTKNNIIRWRLDLAEHTMYLEKESFINYKILEEQRIKLLEYFNNTKNQANFNIDLNLEIQTYSQNKEVKKSTFQDRNYCSGNLSY